MNESDLKTIRDLVEAAGLRVSDSRYEFHAFGSWYLTVATSPPRRITWDGKDGWLYIQQETEEIVHGSHTWTDVWIGKKEIDHTPERAVSELMRVTNA
jgi:hypothetical protein